MPKEVKIISRFNLSNDDLNCLFLLYLPLIGNDAISLYTFMHSLLDRKTLATADFKIENMLDLLGWQFKKYQDSLAKLEAINLVNNYEKEDNSLLILLAPLTAKNFLADSNLGMYLNAKIGDDLYDKLLEKFSISTIDLEGYQNVTKSFDEVFASALMCDNRKARDMLIGKKPNKGTNLTEFDFDFDLFFSRIDKNKVTSLGDFKKKIISVAYAYGYSLEQMVNLYYDSLDKDGNFSFDNLKKKASTLYTYLTNEKNVELEVKSEADDLENFFNNKTALELLATITNGFYDKTYLKKIADIYDALDYERGIINVMITYVYKEKGNIPAVSYFEKVAKSWQDKGITSTSMAIQYLETGKYPNQSKNNKNNDIELEDWQKQGMEDMWKGILGNAKN